MKKNDFFRVLTAAFPVLSLTLLFSSCQHDTVDPELLPEICFEQQILPVFLSSCGTTGCHSAADDHEYVFTDYSGILRAVKAGNPDRSAAYIAISASHGEDMMPPAQPLSEQNRMLIRAWISQGALYTTCETTDSITDTVSNYYNPYACFNRDILPVLRSSCAMTGCHDAATHREGYIFDNYTNTMKAVVAGKPLSSKLYEVITKADGEDRMPPSPYSRLAQSQIDSIYNWIKRGALDEDCGTQCDTISEVSYSLVVEPIIAANCRACHTGTSPSGGIRLDAYQDVATLAASGKLTGVLRGTGTYTPMPPSGPLDECQIRQIELWVEAGYNEN